MVMKCRAETWRPRSGAASTKVATTPARMAEGGAPAIRMYEPDQADRHACAYPGRDGEEPEGEVDHGRQYGDVLARDGEHVRDAGALELRLQILGHERPVAEDHPPHHGGLARPEAVS